jgi:Ca2+-binding RTX toxin-like protein
MENTTDTLTNTNTESTELTNPSLGMGLNGVADWSTQIPFIDHFKASRIWLGHLPGRWGGIEASEMNLDDKGWVTSLPVVDGEERPVSTLMLRGINGQYPGGRYVVLYEGEGELNYKFDAKEITSESVPGRDILEVTPGEGGIYLEIASTDPNNTGDYLRNIRVIHEDQLPLYEAGATFNPDWIEKIEDFRSLRFMDWMHTNGSDQQHWEDRPQVDNASWGSGWDGGVPLEVMIDLANEVNADPWFNIPHKATDDYIQNFAEQVHQQLDPRLEAYVEFSNEVWNWGFSQSKYAEAAAEERWGSEIQGGWMQWYGMRSAQMADIFTEVFGEEADDRLELTIATQTRYKGLQQYLLNAPAWVAEGNEAPHTRFDNYAITGYFSGGLGRAQNVETVKSWFDDPDGGFEKALQQLRDGSLLEDGDSVEATIADFHYHGEVAAEYGLEMVVYEGGTHVVGVAGRNEAGEWVDVVNDREMTEFFIELNRRPEMADFYKDILDGWKDAGGTLFAHFVDVGRPSKWGSWGALSHLEDSTPRWDAITDFNEDNSGWWETRNTTTFSNGLLLDGDETDNTLTGGAEEDYLAGQDGNDTLSGGGRNDGLNGGNGNDSLLGGGGDDFLGGGSGEDTLKGGNGNDLLEGGEDRDRLFGQAGDDILSGGLDRDILRGATGDDSLNGDEGNDRLFGDAGDDSLNGGEGNDFLRGGTEDDVLNGDVGNDNLRGEDGNDLLNGEADDDRLFGDAGDDSLNGGEGNDFLRGGTEDDVLNGDVGNDTLRGEDGNDLLNGEADDDRLFGDAGDDTLNGGDGNDVIQGGNDADQLMGGSGDDDLRGQAGKDTLEGGEGNDNLNGGGQRDIVIGGSGNDTLNGGGGHDTLTGVDPEAVNPGQGEIDRLIGASGNDQFYLGDIHQAYYDDENVNDYALIEGFEGDVDTIYLHGNVADYQLQLTEGELPAGVGIFLTQTELVGEGELVSESELVGVISGVTEADIDLTGSQFMYVNS